MIRKEEIMKRVLFALTVGGLLVGCAPSTPTATPSAPATNTTTTTAPPTDPNAIPAAVGTITIKDGKFSPADQTINAGQSVTFTNGDSVAHTASPDDLSFETGALNPGESLTVKLSLPGKVTYQCTYHPSEKGVINVK